MDYLQIYDLIFDAIGKTEDQHHELLQYADDKEALLEFPCETKEEYTKQTGKSITDEDFKTIIILNTLYNMLYDLECALSEAGIEL